MKFDKRQNGLNGYWLNLPTVDLGLYEIQASIYVKYSVPTDECYGGVYVFERVDGSTCDAPFERFTFYSDGNVDAIKSDVARAYDERVRSLNFE